MKFNININQKAIINNGLDIDLVDAAIIDCLRNMFAASWCSEMVINGIAYKWIAATKVVEEMPLLKLKKNAVQKRLRNIEALGLIERSPENQSMGRSFFRATRKLDLLFSSQGADTDMHLGKNIPTPLVSASQPPWDINPTYNNTIDNNTIDNNTKSADSKNQLGDVPLKEKNEVLGKGNKTAPDLKADTSVKKEKKSSGQKKKSADYPEDEVVFPAHLDNEGFRAVWWGEYRPYRKEGKSKKRIKFWYSSAKYESKAIAEIGRLHATKEAAINAVETCIEKGWEAFFGEKQQQANTTSAFAADVSKNTYKGKDPKGFFERAKQIAKNRQA